MPLVNKPLRLKSRHPQIIAASRQLNNVVFPPNAMLTESAVTAEHAIEV